MSGTTGTTETGTTGTTGTTETGTQQQTQQTTGQTGTQQTTQDTGQTTQGTQQQTTQQQTGTTGTQQTTGTTGTQQTQQQAPAWPENWRQLLAGDDKTRLTQLERMADPTAIWKQNVELQAMVSAGKLKTALPENATPEQKTAWRKENGLPETADGYVATLALPDGKVFGEADKPIISALAATALEGDIPPAAFNGVVAKYYELQDKARQARVAADATFHDQSVAALTTAWGETDYLRNTTMIGNLVASTFPADFAPLLNGARLADGTLLADHPAYLKSMADIARKIVPVSTIVPANSDAAASMTTRRGEIEKLMGDRASTYWRGPTAAAMQKEYRDIVAATSQPQGGRAA